MASIWSRSRPVHEFKSPMSRWIVLYHKKHREQIRILMDLLLEPHIKNKSFDLHVIVWYKLINIWRFLFDLCLIELTYSRGACYRVSLIIGLSSMKYNAVALYLIFNKLFFIT